jgi:hypothetical protein
MDQLTIGGTVRYVMPDGETERPAIITQVWNRLDHASHPGMCNMTVFPDGLNDGRIGRQFGFPAVCLGSVGYSAEKLPNTWHWPERV